MQQRQRGSIITSISIASRLLKPITLLKLLRISREQPGPHVLPSLSNLNYHLPTRPYASFNFPLERAPHLFRYTTNTLIYFIYTQYIHTKAFTIWNSLIQATLMRCCIKNNTEIEKEEGEGEEETFWHHIGLPSNCDYPHRYCRRLGPPRSSQSWQLQLSVWVVQVGPEHLFHSRYLHPPAVIVDSKPVLALLLRPLKFLMFVE